MRIQLPADRDRDALIEAASAIDLRRRVGRALSSPTITAADMHRAAHGSDPDAFAAVLAASRTRPALRRILDRELDRAAIAAAPALRAASTGEIQSRSVGPYRLTVKRAESRANAVFLVVEMDADAPSPGSLSATTDTGGAVLRLAAAIDGVVQMTLPADHEMLAFLRDPSSRIHVLPAD
jgi:hypothetical protein